MTKRPLSPEALQARHTLLYYWLSRLLIEKLDISQSILFYAKCVCRTSYFAMPGAGGHRELKAAAARLACGLSCNGQRGMSRQLVTNSVYATLDPSAVQPGLHSLCTLRDFLQRQLLSQVEDGEDEEVQSRASPAEPRSAGSAQEEHWVTEQSHHLKAPSPANTPLSASWPPVSGDKPHARFTLRLQTSLDLDESSRAASPAPAVAAVSARLEAERPAGHSAGESHFRFTSDWLGRAKPGVRGTARLIAALL